MTGMRPADEPLTTEHSFNASFASYAFSGEDKTVQGLVAFSEPKEKVFATVNEMK